jgi:hypothetical protein
VATLQLSQHCLVAYPKAKPAPKSWRTFAKPLNSTLRIALRRATQCSSRLRNPDSESRPVARFASLLKSSLSSSALFNEKIDQIILSEFFVPNGLPTLKGDTYSGDLGEDFGARPLG